MSPTTGEVLINVSSCGCRRHFRDPKGGIEVLASTTTLAAGINTPASTVILAEQEFIGEDERPFTVAEYKNMAGRGGRLGFNGTGKAIILAENPFQPASRFGDTVVQALRRWVGDEIAFWCRCKRAAILAEWMEGASIQGD